MVEIQLALSLIALYFAWTLWTKVALDDCRDRLFDLRDELRDYFHSHQQLDSPHYAEARFAINAMIRYTEKLTIWGLMFQLKMSRTPEVAPPREPAAQINMPEHETSRKVNQVRTEATSALLVYLVESSLPLFLMGTVLLCIQFLLKLHRNFGEMRDDIAKTIMKPWISPVRLESLARASSRSQIKTIAACAKVMV